MKKSVFSLALIAALALPMAVSAQEVKNAPQSDQQQPQGKFHNPIFNGIELTDEQKAQLAEIENPFMIPGPQFKARADKDVPREHHGHGKEHGRHEGRHQHRQMAECPNAEQCQQQGQCQQDQQCAQCPKMGENGEPDKFRHQGFQPKGFPERQEMMQKMVESRTEYLQKVSQVLTPEQYNKFLENMVVYQQMPMRPFRDENFKPRHQGRMHPMNVPASEGNTEGVVVGVGHHKADKNSKK